MLVFKPQTVSDTRTFSDRDTERFRGSPVAAFGSERSPAV